YHEKDTLCQPVVAYRLRKSSGASVLGIAHRLQLPPPLGLKYFSYLSAASLNSSASVGGGFFRVMLGQAAANSRLSSSHRSAGGSLSGMMASTGHSGSHTPQSMHSSGWITNMFSPS